MTITKPALHSSLTTCPGPCFSLGAKQFQLHPSHSHILQIPWVHPQHLTHPHPAQQPSASQKVFGAPQQQSLPPKNVQHPSPDWCTSPPSCVPRKQHPSGASQHGLHWKDHTRRCYALIVSISACRWRAVARRASAASLLSVRAVIWARMTGIFRRAGGLGGVVMMFGGRRDIDIACNCELRCECRECFDGGLDETGAFGLMKGTLR